MEAGRLKHRIKVQKKVNNQDADGNLVENFENVAEIWAEIKDVSAREYLASSSMQTKITTKIVVRYASYLEQDNLRILYKNRIYRVEGALNDPKMENIYLTLLCSNGVNEGQ